jgi:chemotaxis protein methyltransferase CheR
VPFDPAPEAGELEQARALADSGQYQRAGEICRRIIEADSVQAPAWFTLGLVFEQTSSLREAQDAFRRAIYLDRGFALAHYHLGISLQNAGSTDAARKSFENAIELVKGPADELVPQGEGMTAGELADLARMHLELLPTARKGNW